jgi:uncharacterized protein YjbI with pentapeptide repeats
MQAGDAEEKHDLDKDWSLAEVLHMRWLKRKFWKVGIAIAGMLLLVLMVWVPVSVAGAGERTSRLATPVTGPVQATPTEDATVTALNKEKLAQEVQQLKNQNAPDLLGWLRTNAAVLVVVIGGLIGLFRWFGDRRSERKKRMEERFQAAVTGLGDDREDAKIGAASLLRTFLRPGYEQFYTQIFDLAVAHLRPRKPDLETTHDPEATALAPLNQALIAVLEEAFPRAREWVKQGSPSSRLQRITAWLKRILRREKPFDPRSLDARYIQLGGAFLLKADLEQVWMPHAFLQDTDLTEANLGGASLWRGNLTKANLSKANLCRADLGQDILSEADLTEARLCGATLWGVDLTKANLSRADLSRADLSEATRFPVSLRQRKLETTLFLAILSEANLTEANLEGADLLLADLNGADLSEANLEEADLSGADLSRAKLCKARLCGAKLMEVLLSGAKDDLREADVSQIKLTEISCAELSRNGPVPHEANRNARYWKILREWANRIDEAQPPTADLSKAEHLPVDLNGADLAGADFRGVQGLTKEQLEACKAKGAIIDEDSLISSSQLPVSHPLPSQSNDVQTQSAPPVQEGISTPDIGGISAG